MSHEALDWVDSLKGLTWGERLVLRKLAHHTAKGQCRTWVGVDRIADADEIDRRSVRRILRRLEGKRLVHLERAGGGRKRGSVSPRYEGNLAVYRLTIPGYPEPDGDDSYRDSPVPVSEVDTGTLQHQYGDPAGPNTGTGEATYGDPAGPNTGTGEATKSGSDLQEQKIIQPLNGFERKSNGKSTCTHANRDNEGAPPPALPPGERLRPAGRQKGPRPAEVAPPGPATASPACTPSSATRRTALVAAAATTWSTSATTPGPSALGRPPRQLAQLPGAPVPAWR